MTSKTGVYQLQEEIARIVNRYSEESDLTAAELIGALEIEKQVWVTRLLNRNHEPE